MSTKDPDPSNFQVKMSFQSTRPPRREGFPQVSSRPVLTFNPRARIRHDCGAQAPSPATKFYVLRTSEFSRKLIRQQKAWMFQSTRPYGRDLQHGRFSATTEGFNPRARRRKLQQHYIHISDQAFQSTRPHLRELVLANDTGYFSQFQSTAPTGANRSLSAKSNTS